MIGDRLARPHYSTPHDSQTDISRNDDTTFSFFPFSFSLITMTRPETASFSFSFSLFLVNCINVRTTFGDTNAWREEQWKNGCYLHVPGARSLLFLLQTCAYCSQGASNPPHPESLLALPHHRRDGKQTLPLALAKWRSRSNLDGRQNWESTYWVFGFLGLNSCTL